MKRALLVGIDEYVSFSRLRGCVNDVNALLPLLTRNEDDSPNFPCIPLTSATEKVTRRRLLDSVDQLLAPGADLALFYFAGHGRSEQNDLVLVCQDGTPDDPGVPVATILARAIGSPVREIIIILDCCFSGGAGGIPQLGGDISALRSGISILTASRGDQKAVETEAGRGLFSTHLCGALDGGASDVLGAVSIAGVYAYLSQSCGPWDSRPMFKANVERLNDLRRCAPAVPLHELRRLPQLFPDPDTTFPLDPSHEPTALPHHSENEAVFAVLQRCRAAKLVQPVGEEHMYFAAMKGTGCRLTPLGKHCWHLAQSGLL
jgi:hypothetical protein